MLFNRLTGKMLAWSGITSYRTQNEEQLCKESAEKVSGALVHHSLNRSHQWHPAAETASATLRQKHPAAARETLFCRRARSRIP